MDRVTTFQIPTDDKEGSSRFYSDVFGWQINDVPVQMEGGTASYTTALTVPVEEKTMRPTEPGAINGALIPRTPDISGPVIIVTVDSIDEQLGKVTEAGGRVVEGKREVTNMGYYAYAADPAGNVIGLWEDMRGGR